MRILHISDLHLGKQVHGFSMQEEQKDLIEKLLKVIDQKQVDLLLIAGDIFDRNVPSEWAIRLFDDLLQQLAIRQIDTCLIAGNHDSSIRLKYGDWLFERQNIHIYAQYDGTIHRHDLIKGTTKVSVYMVPFLKKSYVRSFYEEDLESDEEAMKLALSKIELDPSAFNILMAHQFVAGAKTCDSELKSVGGTDAISAAVFKDFDYVALGHLHSPQKMSEQIVYSGSLLKYSVDEVHQEKRALLLHVEGKEWTMEKIAIEPLRDLIEIKGSYEQLVERSFYKDLDRDAYFSIVLEDEQDVMNAMNKLQVIYPRILRLRYADRKQEALSHRTIDEMEALDPFDLISTFYKERNGQEMSEEQKRWSMGVWEKIACDQ